MVRAWNLSYGRLGPWNQTRLSVVAKFVSESRGLSPFNLMLVRATQAMTHETAYLQDSILTHNTVYAGAAIFEDAQKIFVGIRSHW
jgi:hypothetical protein